VALFINLKAAFDSVDRRVLIEAMRESGIGEKLIERVEEVIRETKSSVRLVGEVGKGFWTTKRLETRMSYVIQLADS